MSKSVGELGEELVARWLQLRGDRILHQRWHCRWGEIDLIVRQKSPSILAFVEIKTRSSRNWDANGLLAVNPAKQTKLIKTANLFLATNPDFESLSCRFDVAIVSHKPTKEKSNLTIDSAIVRMGQPLVLASGCELTLLDYLEGAFEVT